MMIIKFRYLSISAVFIREFEFIRKPIGWVVGVAGACKEVVQLRPKSSCCFARGTKCEWLISSRMRPFQLGARPSGVGAPMVSTLVIELSRSGRP
jgi:hypothetical protein